MLTGGSQQPLVIRHEDVQSIGKTQGGHEVDGVQRSEARRIESRRSKQELRAEQHDLALSECVGCIGTDPTGSPGHLRDRDLADDHGPARDTQECDQRIGLWLRHHQLHERRRVQEYPGH